MQRTPPLQQPRPIPETPKNINTCSCNKRNTREMIRCFDCKVWFHFKCVGLNRKSAEMSIAWKCTNCRFAFPKPTHPDTASVPTTQPKPVTRLQANTNEQNIHVQQNSQGQQINALFQRVEQLISLQKTQKQSMVKNNKDPDIEWLDDDMRANFNENNQPVQKSNTNPLPDAEWFEKMKKQNNLNNTAPNTGAIPKIVTDKAVISSVPSNGAKSISSGHMNPTGTSSPKSSSRTDRKKALSLELIQQQENLLRKERELLEREKELVNSKLSILEDDSSDTDESVIIDSNDVPHVPEAQTNNPSRDKPRTYYGDVTLPQGVPNQYFNGHVAQNRPAAPPQFFSRPTPQRLPNFGGDPEDWPIFISAFEVSTQQCAISKYENMIRLQQCLKGNAFMMVKSLLNHPDNVEYVIETLKCLFGRPEQLLLKQIENIRREPGPKVEKLETIIRFANAIRNLVSNLCSAGLTGHLNSPLLLQELVEKLPDSMKMQWATHIDDKLYVNLETLNNWTHKMAMCAARVKPTLDLTKTESPKRLHYHQQDNERESKSEWKCFLCDGKCKTLAECPDFLNQSNKDRWNTLRRLNFCKQCLSRHRSTRCPKPTTCKNGCKKPHHPLMHKDVPTDGESTPKQTEQNQGHNFHHSYMKNLSFRYVPVLVHANGSISEELAFLDEGSDGTFIENGLAKKLSLEGPINCLRINWTGSTSRVEKNSKRVSCKISGVYEGAPEFDLQNAQTVESLNLVPQSLNYDQISSTFTYLSRLPVKSYSNQRPKILIGLNNWKLAVPLKVREGQDSEPIAAKSRLGWTIFAANNSQHLSNAVHSNFHTFQEATDETVNLHDLVKNYYSIESLGVEPPSSLIICKEMKRANEILQSTTKQVKGRYETGLLWKYHHISLPDSRPMALQRSMSLNKRLKMDKKLKENLDNQIKEYLKKGYARKLSASELQQKHDRIWYLPIFPVLNPKKPDKVRIVWDASAKVNGISLNSMLSKGPDMLSSLYAILLRFRQRKFAVSGDIREMFHQVKIIPEDQHAQRFLYHLDDEKEPGTYVMNVMTFGAACSPTSAQFVKNLNAEKHANQNPQAVHAIVKNHYVDDYLDSFDSINAAIKTTTQVKEIHETGGFDIRNWKSNSHEILKALGENICTSKNTHDMNIESAVVVTEKVLGMFWNFHTDTFTYSLKYVQSKADVLMCRRKPTKRELLSIQMSIYDPLGLISHYLNYFKILVQSLWKSGLSWNEHIDDEQNEQWKCWANILPQIVNIKIPRCYLSNLLNYNNTRVQIHVFVDASKNICAATAYIRIEMEGIVNVSLLGSKSKVAPLKLISIPRLELIAAVLGARLSKTLVKSLSVPIDGIIHWSDSTTVLSWVRNEPRKIKGQFIQFRTAEIQELSDPSTWRYIPSKLNVADEATKWNVVPDFQEDCRWFKGPQFLMESEQNWPTDIHKELEPEYTISVHQTVTSIIDVNRFSSYKRLLRTTGYVIRFCNAVKPKGRRPTLDKNLLSSEELLRAENFLISNAQQQYYEDEYNCLVNDNNKLDKLDSKSPIYQMCPFIDENKVLRSNGRLKYINRVSEDIKKPILLPRRHHLTELIVLDYHERFHHQMNETIVNELRQRFHIPKIRQVVKSICKMCNWCKIRKAIPAPPQMGPIPNARAEAFTSPFTYTGVDFFGPISVAIGRRQEKRWGVLFTCLTTRAIHIEIASKLDTDTFILCFRDFINRRGQPREMFSDRGTNFIGAEKVLKEELKSIDSTAIAKQFVSPQLKWNFNPPASPHMGGCWERLVRSVKKILYITLPTRTPSDQLLRSYLIEIENIINSRPLTYLPIESEETEALTPNHLLRPTSYNVATMGEFEDDNKVLKQNWMTSQQLANRFWKRWIREYLPTLNRRTKWCKPTKPLQQGDIVIIVDENNPRNCWPKGRVLSTNIGKDGQVRSCVVKTLTGTYERPVAKLAQIDVGAPNVSIRSTGGEDVENKLRNPSASKH